MPLSLLDRTYGGRGEFTTTFYRLDASPSALPTFTPGESTRPYRYVPGGQERYADVFLADGGWSRIGGFRNADIGSLSPGATAADPIPSGGVDITWNHLRCRQRGGSTLPLFNWVGYGARSF